MNPAVSVFDRFADEYDQWFDENTGIYTTQIALLLKFIPHTKRCLEIGVGSGRFASKLGIGHGIDPSLRLLVMARQRGLETVLGKGEFLPYRDGTFNRILMMTVICFMDDVSRSFQEAFRVIVPGGMLVVAFLERNGEVARREQACKPAGRFLKNAEFLTGEQVIAALTRAGFSGACVQENLHGISIVTAQKEELTQKYGERVFVPSPRV